MISKTTILTIAFIGSSILMFAQKDRKNKISVDSLYLKDIQDLKLLYPNMVVRESNNIPTEIQPNGVDVNQKIFRVKYPQYAKENDIQGSVYCRFIIDTLGHVKDVKIIKGVGGGCTEEALRVLNEFSKEQMLPYIINGTKVVLYQKIYIQFKLL